PLPHPHCARLGQWQAGGRGAAGYRLQRTTPGVPADGARRRAAMGGAGRRAEHDGAGGEQALRSGTLRVEGIRSCTGIQGGVMKRKHETQETLGSRLMAALFSLFVSVPTAALIWLWVNRELASWGGFVSSSYLLVAAAVFALVACVVPRLCPSLLGRIWHGMIRVNRWFGW